MTNILHITASIKGATSVSRQLSSKLVQQLASGSDNVVERDLSVNDLPLLDITRFTANGLPANERSPAQAELAAIADTLIAELQAADTIVLGVPIYNFGAPSTMKVWADLVARAGTTFHYTANGAEGLLAGKKAYITVASGGTKVDSETDFMTPWLRLFLGFIGIQDVEIIAADQLMAGSSEAKIAEAEGLIGEVAA